MSKSQCWAEIHCDYLDGDQFWRVNARKTNDKNETERVIAYIDDQTGRVLHIDSTAYIDAAAQGIINTKVKEIELRNANQSLRTANDPTTWKKPVKVTIREITTYEQVFDASEDKNEDEIIDEAMWLHTDSHFVPDVPIAAKFIDAKVEYISLDA